MILVVLVAMTTHWFRCFGCHDIRLVMICLVFITVDWFWLQLQ